MKTFWWMSLFVILGCLFLPVLACATSVSPPVHGCYVGAFPGTNTIFDVEKEIGKKVPLVLSFTDRWGLPYTFPADYARVLWTTGHLLVITWQPQTDLASIIAGKWDDYIRSWGKAAAAYGHPVMLRFGHEMNGTWYPWCGKDNGGSETLGYGDPGKPDGPEKYVDAYRHVHDLFKQLGANNVIWVWSPNEGNPVGASWNALENYYPGDAYVNWLGIDGYNWGTSRPWSYWRSFDEIFGDFYGRLTKLAPGKPIMIAEFASSEQGGNKANWITNAFQRIKTDYPRIKAFIWFDIIKETEWAIDSSLESLAAFQKAMQDSYYVEELILKEDE